jgi:hypothetical protein
MHNNSTPEFENGFPPLLLVHNENIKNEFDVKEFIIIRKTR